MGHLNFVTYILFYHNNKIKNNFIVSLPRLLPYRVVQWVRGITTNLLVMSLNPAWNSTIFIFPKIFKTYFSV